MDQTLLNIRDALTNTRVQVAQRFQRMTEVIDKWGLACFLVVYCRQAAVLSHWMSEWNEQLRQKMTAHMQQNLNQIFVGISEKLLRRHKSLDQDTVNVTQWVALHLDGVTNQAHNGLLICAGMKQLRFLFQECIKRSDCVNWLLIMTELERLRIVHGFTLIKMCELYFGKSILRCFTHIHYQHQNQDELFVICEQALEDHIQLHTSPIQTMIGDVNMAIESYANFIDDCYQVATKRVAQDVKSESA